MRLGDKRGVDYKLDVLHLMLKPPFRAGSYNRTMARFIERDSVLRQAILSYSEDRGVNDATEDDTLLVSPSGRRLWQRMYLTLPGSVRKRLLGVRSRSNQVFEWAAVDFVNAHRPPVVVCYDLTQMGQVLRQKVKARHRTILAQRGLSYRLDRRLAQKVYSLDSYDAVWTLSRASYEEDKGRVSSYQPEVVVVPNCVDTDQFRPSRPQEKTVLRRKWGLPPDRPVVLLLARLHPKKGAHLIIQSWPEILQRIPEAFLWVVGGGEQHYVDYLTRTIRTLGIDHSVMLQGRVDGSRVHECYKAADTYVFPTLHLEGMALSLLEAMSTGLPCIASHHPPAAEHHGSDEVILVRDSNCVNAFVNPIVTMLKNPEMAARMGRAARDLIEEKFSYRVVFPMMEEFLYRQVAMVDGRKNEAVGKRVESV